MSTRQSVLAGLLVFSACYAQTPARLEFEAASVKPVDGAATYMFCRGGPGTSDPGLFRCENWSLANLIVRAYLLGPNQLSAPDWTGGALFNIDAKISPGATGEQFCVMLQNLLADRFKLAVHHETREAREYKLVTGSDGPKFKPAAKQKAEANGDPAQEVPAPNALGVDKEGYPIAGPGQTVSRFDGRTRMYEPRMTMQGLAARLSSYLHATVTDATGLNGEYEISIGFWIPLRTLAPATRPPARHSFRPSKRNWDCVWKRRQTGRKMSW
jgi:uncharacterized protein (TIGR03435 family)